MQLTGMSDGWDGLYEFFAFDAEICVTRISDEARAILCETEEGTREQIGENARRRVLANHTAAHGVGELQAYLNE